MSSSQEHPEPQDALDDATLEEVTAAVYSELRRLAAGYLKGDGHATLQPTALVHEVYMRMAGQDGLRWRNRGHFFGIAARSMRQILVEHARARGAAKRGGDVRQSDPDEILRLAVEPDTGILALDTALSALAEFDAGMSRIIELYYFAGLNYEELAETLQVSTTTVKRDLRVARAWLRRELTAG